MKTTITDRLSWSDNSRPISVVNIWQNMALIAVSSFNIMNNTYYIFFSESLAKQSIEEDCDVNSMPNKMKWIDQ